MGSVSLCMSASIVPAVTISPAAARRVIRPAQGQRVAQGSITHHGNRHARTKPHVAYPAGQFTPGIDAYNKRRLANLEGCDRKNIFGPVHIPPNNKRTSPTRSMRQQPPALPAASTNWQYRRTGQWPIRGLTKGPTRHRATQTFAPEPERTQRALGRDFQRDA